MVEFANREKRNKRKKKKRPVSSATAAESHRASLTATLELPSSPAPNFFRFQQETFLSPRSSESPAPLTAPCGSVGPLAACPGPRQRQENDRLVCWPPSSQGGSWAVRVAADTCWRLRVRCPALASEEGRFAAAGRLFTGLGGAARWEASLLSLGRELAGDIETVPDSGINRPCNNARLKALSSPTQSSQIEF